MRNWIICLLIPTGMALGQQAPDTLSLAHTLHFSGNYLKNNQEQFITNVGTAHTAQKGSFQMFLKAGFAYGEIEHAVNQREYSLETQPRIKDIKKLYFGHYRIESSFQRGIALRQFMGGGAGFTYFDRHGINLSVSDAILYDITQYSNDRFKETLRNSLRHKVKVNTHNFSFRHEIYWQPSLQVKNDVLVTSDLTLSWQIISHVSLSGKYVYTLETNNLNESTPEVHVLTAGITAEF